MSESQEGFVLGPEDEKWQRVRAFVLERWEAFSLAPEQYQWPLETERWHELAFCLLYRIGQPHLQAEEARRIVEILAELDLLEVEELASWMGAGGEVDHNQPDAQWVLGLLGYFGLPLEKATVALSTWCQAAQTLQQGFGGKLQRYLRQYGQQMVDDMQQRFRFTQIDDADARQAFTHWLQNVLNMPLALMEPAVEQLCEALELTPEEWVTLADELDLNLALLDDMAASATAAFE